MYDDDDLSAADPWDLSRRNYAIWWLGRRVYSLMHDIKFKATPDAIRYVHRDPVENDSILLRELIHSFQKDMSHSERTSFRECLTLLFPPRGQT